MSRSASSLLCLLALVVALQVASSAPLVPSWPEQVTFQIPPFLSFSSDGLSQYHLKINTLSPTSWKPAGVTGTILYNCATTTRYTIFESFGFSDQCTVARTTRMPTCGSDMFPTMFKVNSPTPKLANLRQIDESSIPVYVWNVTINEDQWSGVLDLTGYEKYTTYIETRDPNPTLRSFVALGDGVDSLWYGKFSPFFEYLTHLNLGACKPTTGLEYE
eukprot:TRINITY_DN762_c0_g1_i1.p1 TRINITY_DN762_c0_g1~~TRINITY_DN762_c0_g1_i1.p1  ORF type:complete len:232 (-),score=38.37 TRINITY_DN762_c0_g1_i1:60-710(-)